MKTLKLICALTALVLSAACAPTREMPPLPPEAAPSAAETALKEMTLDEKLWQLFFVTPESVSGYPAEKAVSEAFEGWAKQRPVGGVILFADNISSAEQVRSYTEGIEDCFSVPVFIGVDEEGGTVSRLGRKGIVTDNGDMRDIGDGGDPSEAALVGSRLGSELSALGFSLDFAPVADTITNPANTEIGRRAFSADASTTAAMVRAETEAMQAEGVSAVLKHFPGHGSTSVNSHTATSVSERSLDELRAEDMKPFAAGIEAGADFVMVSHMSLPAVTGDMTPCSLSPAVIGGLLCEELGFDGVVITDALNMGAVTEPYGAGEAAVMAIEAGADMLLMPADLSEAHEALGEAVETGRITEERIDESVRRILETKEKRGLISK